MENEISIAGIGPKLVYYSVPYLIIVIVILVMYPNFLRMDFIHPEVAIVIGSLFTLAGLFLYIASAITLFKLFKKGKLIQSGTFALCRNPLYASIILFFVPAAAFFTKSYLMLSGSVLLYIIFKIFIKEETDYLEKTFGEEYRQYVARVNEIIPFPRFWEVYK